MLSVFRFDIYYSILPINAIKFFNIMTIILTLIMLEKNLNG